MPSASRNAAHRLFVRLHGEQPAEPDGLRYTRRARVRGEAATGADLAAQPVAGAGLDRAFDRAFGRTGAVPARSIEMARPGPARTRSGVVARGLLAVAVCLVLIASVAMASLAISQPGSAAGDRTEVPAVGAVQSPTPTLLPSASPSPSPTASPSPQATPEPRVGTPIVGSAFLAYRVRAGDTLGRIANDFGLSVTTLYWANSTNVADPQLVKIGQILKIPPMDGLAIAATAGATVKSVADKYGIDAQQLTEVNNLYGPTLFVGQLLLVPGAETPALPVKQPPVKVVNWLGKLMWPAVSHHTITQKFGCSGWYGEPRWGSCAHYHDGLDIGGPTGVPILAAASGTVIYAGWRKRGTDGAAGGIVVWISHGGGSLYTTYNHLSAATVKIGQRVTIGQRIGTMGETGAAVGSHLHFEVWVTYPWSGGDIAGARDPLPYFAKT